MNTANKYKSRNFAIGLAIGIPVGTPIGLVLGNLALGPAVGALIGLILGWVFNTKDKSGKEGEASLPPINSKIWKYTLITGIVVLAAVIVLIKI